uniref:hypothetical protein n=1 Tax=Flavobacterium sp. TaxID=239 RepID=UPI00404779B6
MEHNDISSNDHDLFAEPTKGSKVRAYLLTINNYTEEEHNSFAEYYNTKNVVYLIHCKEIAPTTGTPHMHIYIYHENPVSFNPLKKLYPRANIVTCKGTPLQNRTYCIKDGDYVEYGILPEQGKRTDIDHIRDVLEDTPRMKEVVLVARSYQSIKVAQEYLKYHEEKRNWKPVVKWFYGETGTGKTREAYEQSIDPYPCMSTGKWFEGYDAHEHVIIDDMRRNFMTFNELLKFLDRYAFRVETKGGSRQMLAKQIIITSAFHPADLFKTREDIKQLLRRIDEIRQFGEYEPSQYEDEDS